VGALGPRPLLLTVGPLLLVLTGLGGCLRLTFAEAALEVTYFGYASFLIEDPHAEVSLLLDPWSEALQRHKVSDEVLASVDLIFISCSLSGHYDPSMLKRLRKLNPASRVVTSAEVQARLERERIYAEVALNGKNLELGGLQLRFTPAQVEAENLVVGAAGLLLIAGQTAVYYTGPTRYFDPFVLELTQDVDLLLVPITGQHRTMDFFEAGKFAKRLAPARVAPFGYVSWARQRTTFPEDFLRQFTDPGPPRPLLLEEGQVLRL